MLTARFPLVGIYVPPIYAEWAADEEEYSILESPFYWRTSAVYMLYQAIHEKPLVGGYISRQQPYPTIERLPIMRMFATAAPVYDIIGQDPAEIAPSVFSYFNIRYLSVHSAGGAMRYNTLLRVAQAAAGGTDPQQVKIPGRSVLVYTVTPPVEPLPFIGVGEGWSEPEPRALGAVVRTLHPEGELIFYSAEPQHVILDIWMHSTSTGQGNLHVRIGRRNNQSMDAPGGRRAPLDRTG
jgi:hypothetical protein